jgi:hypothetical protein
MAAKSIEYQRHFPIEVKTGRHSFKIVGQL